MKILIIILVIYLALLSLYLIVVSPIYRINMLMDDIKILTDSNNEQELRIKDLEAKTEYYRQLFELMKKYNDELMKIKTKL